MGALEEQRAFHIDLERNLLECRASEEGVAMECDQWTKNFFLERCMVGDKTIAGGCQRES